MDGEIAEAHGGHGQFGVLVEVLREDADAMGFNAKLRPEGPEASSTLKSGLARAVA